MSTREKFIIAIGIIILALVVVIAVFLLSRSSSEVSTIFGRIEGPDVDSIIRLQSKKLTVDFKTDGTTPKTANVFKILEKEITREKAISMALKLGFTTVPRGHLTLTWKQGNKILDIDLDNRSLNFKNQDIKSLKGKFSAEKLAETALKFIQQRGLSTDGLTADTKNIRIFEVKGTTLDTTLDYSKPIFIEIGFNRELNGYSLFYQNPTDPPVSVILNNKGQIFGVFYKFTNVNKTTVGTYPLVDIKKLEIAKLVNFGSLVFPETGRGVFEPQLIKAITIEDFSLVYLDDQSGEFVEPIYILRGFASVGEETTTAVIYYPAVQEGWLK